MRFASPLYLLLLLLVPLTAWLGWPSSGQSKKRDMISLILRLVIVLCLIFAIAGLEIVQSGNNLAVVFLVDVSDSMPQQAITSEVDYIRTALKSISAIELVAFDKPDLKLLRELKQAVDTTLTSHEKLLK